MEVAQGTPNRLQTTADIFEPQKGRAEKYYRLVAAEFCFLPQLNPKTGWGEVRPSRPSNVTLFDQGSSSSTGRQA